LKENGYEKNGRTFALVFYRKRAPALLFRKEYKKIKGIQGRKKVCLGLKICFKL